jgi:hypothetical protein
MVDGVAYILDVMVGTSAGAHSRDPVALPTLRAALIVIGHSGALAQRANPESRRQARRSNTSGFRVLAKTRARSDNFGAAVWRTAPATAVDVDHRHGGIQGRAVL